VERGNVAVEGSVGVGGAVVGGGRTGAAVDPDEADDRPEVVREASLLGLDSVLAWWYGYFGWDELRRGAEEERSSSSTIRTRRQRMTGTLDLDL